MKRGLHRTDEPVWRRVRQVIPFAAYVAMRFRSECGAEERLAGGKSAGIPSILSCVTQVNSDSTGSIKGGNTQRREG